jgi:hypothetical protein
MAGSEGCCRYCGMANETEPAGPEDDDDDIDKEDEVESDEAAMSEEECDLVSDGDSSCDDANWYHKHIEIQTDSFHDASNLYLQYRVKRHNFEI